MEYCAKHIQNKTWADVKPTLSILAPYFKDDPSELIKALDKQAQNLSGIEIIIYDDGTDDAELTAKIQTVVPKLITPTRAVIAAQNTGRSSARNRLQDAARADWVLFLDADMRPVHDDFLKNYMQLIKFDKADVIFGGFTVQDEAADKDRELHRVLSHVSDCLPLAQRQAKGPQFVASSNLCMRKSVLEAEAFDNEFTGWGWEDSEWAARISKRFTLLHAHNPALHLGLETTDTLLHRFSTSGPNYVRFTQKHPELAQTLSLFKISKKLGKIPAQSMMRPVLKAIIKASILPIDLRLNALKLWRASHYAVDLKGQP
ncbi:MAG: glycosyltransferase [Litorimonas sp.]